MFSESARNRSFATCSASKNSNAAQKYVSKKEEGEVKKSGRDQKINLSQLLR